ncbi:MAG: methionyl-tRNA formyltransferase [Spirochaetaceae bacterium]|nr:MAG: methionyl-tRNA formyltransferase [Spirochaetaceae bacterium]
MRIIFAGTPQLAVPSLEALHASGHTVAGVLTAPPRPAGRGREVKPSSVGAAARRLGLAVLEPERLDSAAREAVQDLKADMLVVAAYGKIFGPKFLGLFPQGGINMHPSLLPRHRGPAPLPAAILQGDTETGITIQRLALEMDAGNILLQETLVLDGTETSASLYEWAAVRGAGLLVDALDGLAAGSLAEIEQNQVDATYCCLLSKEDGAINWKLPAIEIDRLIRAYNPWPGAFTSLKGQKLSLWNSFVADSSAEPEGQACGQVLQTGSVKGIGSSVDTRQGILVQTGKGVLGITQLQQAHKKSLDWKSFCNGFGSLAGEILGGSE